MNFRVLTLCCLFLINANLGTSQQTFTEHIKLHCDDSVIRTHLGYPTWNPATIIKKPQFGVAEIREDSFLRQTMYYKPPIYFHGMDTLIVLCAKATQITCDTGIYILEVSCQVPIDSFIIIDIKCDMVDTFKINYQFEADFASKPFHGQALILPWVENDLVLYKSDNHFKGQDYLMLYLKQLQLTWVLIYNVDCKNISETQRKSSESKKANTILVCDNILDLKFFNLDGTDQEFELHDLAGKYFNIEGTFQSGGVQLKLDQLPNGYYFMILKSSKQFIKQSFILFR